MNELNIKNYAHIGDAVWELYVREKTVFMTENLKKLHDLTVSFVNASFQTELLQFLSEYLTDEEKELVKRAGNIKTSAARRIDRNLHRIATEFEVLLGYNYLHNKTRLDEILKLVEPKIVN
ncbi:MAG: hypothetical protein K6C94_03205 [Candidatus Gastranaerophilales bacterium]|nr:hypothetical protein [Candidatus Gastranaerophilales bacterium]